MRATNPSERGVCMASDQVGLTARERVPEFAWCVQYGELCDPDDLTCSLRTINRELDAWCGRNDALRLRPSGS